MPEPSTLVHQLRARAAEAPAAPALSDRTANGWSTLTWSEYDQRVRAMGRALMALGHQAGERVAIIARNRTDFAVAQLGIMNAGGVPVPIYKTSTAEQVAWILNHAEVRFVFADGRQELDKLNAERMNLPLLEKMIQLDPFIGSSDLVLSTGSFLALSESVPEAALEARLQAVDPEELAFLCYTSGTTGVPKGAMLSHRGLMSTSSALITRFGLPPEGRVLSYLPLSHIAEQIFTLLLPLAAGGHVFFCDDLAKLKEFLPEVRPTIFLGVPRVWEKFQAALKAGLAQATGVKAKLAAWALEAELAAYKEELATGKTAGGLSLWLARKLVISKIHAKLGLDQVLYACTGSAPTPTATLEFFASIGLRLHEGYGMTETSGLLTTSMPHRPVFGTVGQALDRVELKIAEDGEILAKGIALTRGYFKDPEQTAALWEGGWLHTGDVGELDAEGRLRITDRKKELLKTSGGKYIAPQALEARLKTVPGIGQAVAIGDGRKFVSALVALDPEAAPRIAGELGLGGDLGALAANPKMRAWLEEQIEQRVNKDLARYETIKRITILPAELSVDGGELTPTLKLKRKAITQKYATLIEAMYPADDS